MGRLDKPGLAWLLLKSSSGDKIEQAIRLGFSASNNELEYEAILVGIELVAAISVDKLIIESDSQLVVGQVNEECESRDPRMVKYVALVKQRLGSFSVWKLECPTPSPNYRQVCRPLHRNPQPLPLTTRKSCEAKPYCLHKSRIIFFSFLNF